MNDRIDTLVAGLGSLAEVDALVPPAAGRADRAGLPLHLVHAFDLPDPFVDSYLHASTLPGDPLLHYAEGLQARMEGQVGGLAGHGEVHSAVLGEAACDAGCLLVVGPTRRGVAGAALLGTTAQRVLLLPAAMTAFPMRVPPVWPPRGAADPGPHRARPAAGPPPQTVPVRPKTRPGPATPGKVECRAVPPAHP
jgi:hypothetical protein